MTKQGAIEEINKIIEEAIIKLRAMQSKNKNEQN